MDRDGLQELFELLGIRKRRFSAENVSIPCPFAPYYHESGSDSHPSCSIKVAPDGPSLYRCWACKRAGTLVSMLVELKSLGVPLSFQYIASVKEREKIDLDKALIHAKEASGTLFMKQAPQERTLDESELDPFKGRAHRYILDRGFTLETCKEWGIGYDEEWKRVVIPVRRKDGKLVGMVGRTVIDHPDKYMDYPGFKKAKHLFGAHNLSAVDCSDKFPCHDGVIVVEGALDVLRLWQLGIRNVVSMLGSDMSKDQGKILSDHDKPVYLMLDWDKAGINGRKRASRILFGHVPVYSIPGPVKKDPDTLGKDGIDAVVSCLEKARYVLSDEDEFSEDIF